MTTADIVPFDGERNGGFEPPARIEYRGVAVMTTEQLAKAYEVTPDHIHDGHRKNPDRFEEGYHFHKLKGADLKAFRSQPENSRLAHKFSAHLVLWTEAGALRHAKLLESPKAWEVFSKLEDTYFMVKSGAILPAGGPQVQVDRIREGRLSYQHHMRICRSLGITGMPAHLAAGRAVQALLGIDILGAMAITHAEAPGEEPNMTPSTIGKQIGLSGRDVNAALCRLGYQTSFRDAKDRLVYEPTQKGRDAGGRMFDTGKKHGSGAPVTQLMWSSKTLTALKAGLDLERA